jgi:hypothetical protein
MLSHSQPVATERMSHNHSSPGDCLSIANFAIDKQKEKFIITSKAQLNKNLYKEEQ